MSKRSKSVRLSCSATAARILICLAACLIIAQCGGVPPFATFTSPSGNQISWLVYRSDSPCELTVVVGEFLPYSKYKEHVVGKVALAGPCKPPELAEVVWDEKDCTISVALCYCEPRLARTFTWRIVDRRLEAVDSGASQGRLESAMRTRYGFSGNVLETVCGNRALRESFNALRQKGAIKSFQ